MKIVNGKVVPDYHPQIANNTRAFLDRVSVQGVNEARELVRSADFLEALVDGTYHIVSAPMPDPENGDQG